MRIEIKIENAGALRWIDEIRDNLDRALGRVVRKLALLFEREGKIEAPVDTGRLRSSIAADILPVAARIEPHVDYAVFVHEGTRHISANPFMDRAADTVDPQIQDILDEEVKSGVNKS